MIRNLFTTWMVCNFPTFIALPFLTLADTLSLLVLWLTPEPWLSPGKIPLNHPVTSYIVEIRSPLPFTLCFHSTHVSSFKILTVFFKLLDCLFTYWDPHTYITNLMRTKNFLPGVWRFVDNTCWKWTDFITTIVKDQMHINEQNTLLIQYTREYEGNAVST